MPLFPVTPNVGGTILVPNSHLEFENLLELYPKWKDSKNDFCSLGSLSSSLTEKGVLIPMEPGDLLLWDSRLVHASDVGDCSDTYQDTKIEKQF